MKATEYETMAAVEDTHWWFLSQREAMQDMLESAGVFELLRGGVILDAGCGTGGNLRWLQQVLQPVSMTGFDVSPRAVHYANQRVPDAEILCENLCCISPDVPDQPLDLLLCSDVIYAIDHEQAVKGLQQLVNRIKPSGHFLLHVPALSWIRSRHDEAVGTKRRYLHSDVRCLLDQLGLVTVRISYRMCLLLPLLILRRLPSIVFRMSQVKNASSELELPWAPVNMALRTVMRFENFLIRKGWVLPFGSSLIALGRKP